MNYPDDTYTLYRTGQIDLFDMLCREVDKRKKKEFPKAGVFCPNCFTELYRGWNCYTNEYDPVCHSCKKEFKIIEVYTQPADSGEIGEKSSRS